jgi:hypothetical protein
MTSTERVRKWRAAHPEENRRMALEAQARRRARQRALRDLLGNLPTEDSETP